MPLEPDDDDDDDDADDAERDDRDERDRLRERRVFRACGNDDDDGGTSGFCSAATGLADVSGTIESKRDRVRSVAGADAGGSTNAAATATVGWNADVRPRRLAPLVGGKSGMATAGLRANGLLGLRRLAASDESCGGGVTERLRRDSVGVAERLRNGFGVTERRRDFVGDGVRLRNTFGVTDR